MMKGFTLWEPWASLMAHGYKKNETRSWGTRYRGPLVIHAAKTDKAAGAVVKIFKDAGLSDDELCTFLEENGDWPLGKIVAVVELVDCIPTQFVGTGIDLSKVEAACGDYSPGRFAWITKGLRRIEPPIPWKGMQGLWNVPDELRARLIGVQREELREQ